MTTPSPKHARLRSSPSRFRRSWHADSVRFLVYGAGAIGGALGGRLFQAGYDVTLVARGEHAAAIRERGLRLETPDTTDQLPIPVLEPGQLADGDPTGERWIALLAVKSQDTDGAVRDLAASDRVGAVVCLQNGVRNEEAALRSFDDVYGVCVMCPANHLDPGVVTLLSVPVHGMLDIGRSPSGVDATAAAVAEAFDRAGFLSEPRPDIMRWKYRKLVMNLGNAVQALIGPVDRDNPVLERIEDEAARCFAAAGIDPVSVEDDRARRADHIQRRDVPGRPRSGGSSYQSLQRATGSIETDYLNGEICLLGRLHGIRTPVNAVVQLLANRAARERWAPGAMTSAELVAAVGAATGVATVAE